MKTLLSTALVILVATTGTARADQCQAINQKAAEKVSAIIDVGDKFVKYCKSCGDAAPTPSFTVQTAEVMDWAGHPNMFQLFINGAAVDLAYIYKASLTPGKFYNVGKLAGCANSSPASVDSTAGQATAMLAVPAAPPPPADLPPTPPKADVKSALAKVAPAIAACMAGAAPPHGELRVKFTFAGATGEVSSAQVVTASSKVAADKGGDADGKPTACVAAAAKSVSVPPFQAADHTVTSSFTY